MTQEHDRTSDAAVWTAFEKTEHAHLLRDEDAIDEAMTELDRVRGLDTTETKTANTTQETESNPLPPHRQAEVDKWSAYERLQSGYLRRDQAMIDEAEATIRASDAIINAHHASEANLGSTAVEN